MATYTSFSELKDKQLELGDEVQFTIKGEELFYIVNKSFLEESVYTSNAIIFERLNISDKNKYASLIYGYFVVGGKGEYSWPEFRENDYEAATRLVCNLFKKCEAINTTKSSLYQVGDVVLVKDQYDSGCHSVDYPFTFTKKMLEDFGGQKVTITKVKPTEQPIDSKFGIENYQYSIAEDNGRFRWSASMFSGKVDNTSSNDKESFQVDADDESEFSFTKEDIPENYLYHPYVIDQAIKEYSRIRTCSLKNAFKDVTSKEIGTWFTWGCTSQGHVYWRNIYVDPSFIPKDYTPKYYKESKTTSHEIDMDDEPTISSLDEEIIAKTSNKLVIPCSYQETTLSIKPVKVKF